MILDLSPSIDRRAAALRAAAHPVRLQLIMLLKEVPKGLSVSQIQQLLSIDHSTVSHHLSLLRGKGIVAAVPKGTERLYSLEDTRLAEAVYILLR